MLGYRLNLDRMATLNIALTCPDEAEAIKQAKQLVDGHDVELWQLDRKIETFRHSGRQG